MRFAWLGVLVLSIAATGQQTPSQRHSPIFGTYSSLAFDDESGSGDLLGTEIQIIPQYGSARVLFQCAQGVPSEPLLIVAKVTATTVDFNIPDSPQGMCPGRYHGTLTKNGLQLSLNGKRTEVLPRTKSYWAR
jgi:hypothetical protein